VLKVDREVERAIQAHEETVASKYDPRQGFSIGPRRRSRADRGFAETESGIQSELRSIGARTWLTEPGGHRRATLRLWYSELREVRTA
jgi:hypothetical protein